MPLIWPTPMSDWLHHSLRRLRRSAFAFPLALAVALPMVAISEMGYQQTATLLGTLITRSQARLELSHLARRLGEAEAGQRGFLLTGEPDDLLPYRDASVRAVASLARLQSLYATLSDAEGRTDLLALDRQIRHRLGEMDEAVSLYDAGGGDNARGLVLSDIGRSATEAIRRNTDGLLTGQNAEVARGLDQVFDALLLNRVGVTMMTAVSLLVLGMFLRQRRDSDSLRHDQQRQLRDERDRLELEVRHRTAELTELARHLETAREDERALLARDLHDDLGALLTAAKLDVARMRPKLAQSAPDLLPRMAHLVEALNSGIALKRRIIEELRPSSLSTLGLGPALEILCKDFCDRLGLPTDPQIAPVALTPSGELTVYRLVQESFNNIARHARASHVTLAVRPAGDRVTVRITDDGIGFDTHAVGVSHHGLVGMRYRVQAEGGVLSVSSQPGHGTEVHAWLPMRQPSG